MNIRSSNLRAIWREHGRQMRAPSRIAVHWPLGPAVDPRLLLARVEPGLIQILRGLGITLLVSREYEHLLVALRPEAGRLKTSWLPIPHPSGIAVDRRRRRIHVASTRNPNVLFEFAPVTGFLARKGEVPPRKMTGVLLPVRSRFLPGCAYLHDLALVGGVLYGASTGQNAIVELDYERGMKPVWWPKSVESSSGPLLGENRLQLNSIAAGSSLKKSYFTASNERPGRMVPGDLDYPVEKRGVLVSGFSRAAVGRGLTRPHSARLYRGKVWVANSGYGELSSLRNGRFQVLARLPGWTRGLCLREGIAFVGTSRIIPGYEGYAPGVEPEASVCGVHAVNLGTGRVLGSIIWPQGHQIFAVDWMPSPWSPGFPERGGSNEARSIQTLFYTGVVDPP
jgi:uncharacterized protein (TIGR03032 family)